MRSSSVAFWLLASLACATALPAQEHPNVDRGFSPAGSFEMGEIDNVNVFNGNLVLSIPLGGSYPAGGALSYGLTLAYNSNIWDFVDRDIFNGNQTETVTKVIPFRQSNAGFGWVLSLGRIYAPNDLGQEANYWSYWGADGAEHKFYDKLHPGDADDPGDTPGSQFVLYSRDGSYLRMKALAGLIREVEFPDGTVQRFDSLKRLVQIRDRFSNALNITYGANLWTLSDTQGRTHRIYFVNLVEDGVAKPMVDRIELAAFGGGTATYTFSYAAATINRGCPHTDPAVPNTVGVHFLTGVSLPDGSSYAMPLADYITDPTGQPCRIIGGLRGVRLPTWGRLEWDYQTYVFPTESSSRPFRQRSPGVFKRRLRNASGTVLGEWTYTTSLTPPIYINGIPVHEELINTVTDPLGHRTEHYFSVYNRSQTFWGLRHYGLPFTGKVQDANGLFLSTRTYNAAGTLLRSTWVRYELDWKPLGVELETNTNRRLEVERTVFHDDGDRWLEVSHSQFDGLGHYRVTTTNGNFQAGNVRTETADYNPGRGVYHYDQGTGSPAADHTFNMLPASQPWVLETFASKKEEEAGATAFATFCFDTNTGFLHRKRILKNSGTTEHANDVLEVYTPDGAGNLSREQYYGGDKQSLTANGTTCTMALPAAVYQIDHGYQSGVRNSSQYAGASFKSLDLTIDQSSGLPLTSRDSAGLATDYEYDLMGRRTWSKPSSGHGGWVEAVYTPASSSSALATILIRRRANGSKSAQVLANEQTYIDSFGRLWRESRLLPGGVWNVRETLYDAFGRKTSVSELQTGNPNKRTQYLNYDPFGRPGIIRPPDGAAHDVTFTYFGIRQVDRTAKVGTSFSAGTVTETASTTTEVYDGQGRLWRLTEPSGAAGAAVTTTYSYDIGNRIRQVSTTANSVTQNRTFTYDNRGFLLSETHPEKGAAGNGTITYANYDARGHAGRRTDGPADVVFVWDGAERLTQVKEPGAGGRLLKEFVHASANGTNDWRNGKVRTATRWTYLLVGMTPFTVQMTETFVYGGRDGRVSQRDTAMTVNGAPAESFTQSQDYTPLGQLRNINYPTCTHAACGAVSPRTVQNTYANGLLSSVGTSGNPSLYASISYHPNLLVNQVLHGNGVTETQANDPNAMRRPASFTATSMSTSWSSGAYTYDGMGNITKIGTSWFTYDKVSRLTTGTVFDGPSGGGVQKQQTYTFDPFGNLTNIAGTSGRAVPVNAATNRLNSVGVSYDAAGNVTAWNGITYEYDRFNQMIRMVNGAETWVYVYNASDERIWSYNLSANSSRWALRGAGGRILRDYVNSGGVWSVGADYIYRDGQPLAAETSAGRRHFHPDHLGSPRLITDGMGLSTAYHVYYPFGEEATAFNQDTERMKFTGHERDLANLAGPGDDLDYMHARFYSPVTSRFLSTDRMGGDARRPQTWNRYAYVSNNPLRYNDPDGLRQNPVTGQRGVDPTPDRGEHGKIRATPGNRRMGLFGYTRNGGKKYHSGIDINAQEGTPVYAAEGGVVTDIGNRGKGGNRIQITTSNGTVLSYAHLDGFANGLSRGSVIVEGQIVGTAGTTGNAAGLGPDDQHLHFTVINPQGNNIDPVEWLNDPTAPDPRIMSEMHDEGNFWDEWCNCTRQVDGIPR